MRLNGGAKLQNASDSTLGRASKGSLVALGPMLLYSPEHPSDLTVTSLWDFSPDHGWILPLPSSPMVMARPRDSSEISG